MRSSFRTLLVLTGLLGMLAPQVLAQGRGDGRTFSVNVFAHRVSWQVSDGWPHATVIPLIRDRAEGGYQSSNPAIIAAVNREMLSGGIWPMVSWWGPGNNYGGDVYMHAFLSQPGPPLAVLYEATGRLKNDFQMFGTPEEGRGGERINFGHAQNAETFIADMQYLHRTFFTGPSADRFVRIDGRPVIFIWISHAFDGPFNDVMARVRATVPVYLIGSDFSVPFYAREGIETVVPAMDAISAYGAYNWDVYGLQMTEQYPVAYRRATREWTAWMDKHGPHMKIMPPMIFNYDERLIPGRRGYHFSSTPDVARKLTEEVRSIIADPCQTRILPMTFIVSYDECYEGTCIIPSEQYGGVYQDLVRDTFKDPITITPDQLRECLPDRGKGPHR